MKLTMKHMRAIEMLIEDKPRSEILDELKISHATLANWKNDSGFNDAYNNEINKLFDFEFKNTFLKDYTKTVKKAMEKVNEMMGSNNVWLAAKGAEITFRYIPQIFSNIKMVNAEQKIAEIKKAMEEK